MADETPKAADGAATPRAKPMLGPSGRPLGAPPGPPLRPPRPAGLPAPIPLAAAAPQPVAAPAPAPATPAAVAAPPPVAAPAIPAVAPPKPAAPVPAPVVAKPVVAAPAAAAKPATAAAGKEAKTTPLGQAPPPKLVAPAGIKMLTAYPPQAGAAQIGAEISRRDFTALWLKIAWGTFAAGCGIGTLGSVRFMFPNVSFEPPLTFKAGFPRDFAEVGKVYEQFKEKYFTWLIREESGLYALSTTCTHLGCTPNWLQAEQKFKCPCHGSGFRKTGINFEGPAPRPLERWRIAFAEDGQILVDKGKKFQFEKGEWVQSDAFLKLS